MEAIHGVFILLAALVLAIVGGLFLLFRLFSLVRVMISKQSDEITKRLDNVIEGQRLSMILKLEPASLKINPEQFEPQKEKVKARLLEAFEMERHPYPETLAYCIFNRSGLNVFVEGKTLLVAQKALARLIVNDDKESAKVFLGELVDKL